jgi:hypothetical protein
MWRVAFVVLVGLAACGDDGAGDPIDASQDVPTTFDWTIRRGSVVDCANAGATDVYILVRPEAGAEISRRFACALRPVQLSLPPGRYAIQGQLMGPSLLISTPDKAVTVPTDVPVTFDFYLP